MTQFITPQELFGGRYQTVVELMAAHSPFPRAQSDAYRQEAKIRAARIHLDETVFFAQVVYNDLKPQRAVELCAGFGIPSITLAKLYGLTPVCVDTDDKKMEIGAIIADTTGVVFSQAHTDLFIYLRKNAPALRESTLLATAAYCRDKKKGRPAGSGEKDIVQFARTHRLNVAILPFRSGDILKSGVSSEKVRIKAYRELLEKAGFVTRSHSTEPLFRGQGAPDWFFLDILTAACGA